MTLCVKLYKLNYSTEKQVHVGKRLDMVRKMRLSIGIGYIT